MLQPVIKSIEVECTQEQAFKIFVEGVSNWWPRDKNSVSAMNGEVAKKIVIEPRLGGKVYEIGHDDQEHHWGTVTVYNPYDGFSLDWHIGLEPEKASDVTVTFEALDNNRTRVNLTHSRWENFGDKAADMREGYNSGWIGVFEQAYKAACSTATT